MHTDRPRVPGIGRAVPAHNEAVVDPGIPDHTVTRAAVFSDENEDSPQGLPVPFTSKLFAKDSFRTTY